MKILSRAGNLADATYLVPEDKHRRRSEDSLLVDGLQFAMRSCLDGVLYLACSIRIMRTGRLAYILSPRRLEL